MRQRTPRDEPPADDFGFDFVDEPATVENAAPRPAAPRVVRPRAVRPTQRIAVSRVAGATAVAIVVAVLAITLIGGGGTAAADRAYVARLGLVATDSQAVGADVQRLLARASVQPDQLAAALGAAARRQEQDVIRAAAIVPPPRLRAVQRQVVDALELRVSGVAGLAGAVDQARAAAASQTATWPPLLAAQAARLVASDVIWRDLVQAPLQARLGRDGASGSAAPGSVFLRSPDLATPTAMATVVDALHGTGSPQVGAAATLKAGVSGPQVATWQRRLNRWLQAQPAKTTLPVSGTFDAATVAATQAFQTASGLTADGVVGPATRAALVKALAGSG